MFIHRVPLASAQGGDVVVDWLDTKQIIDGFGAANGHQGLDATTADLFFNTIGLSLYRMPFSSGGTGAYGSEVPDFYGDIARARSRGALVWTAPWTANNATWKDNGSLVSGNLLPAHYADWSAVMCGLQADVVANAGYTLYGMSVGNEPDFVATYESMLWSAANMTTFIKNNLGPGLAALSPRPFLIAPECENWDTSGTYLSTLSADSAAWAYIDIIATHQYEGTVAQFNTTKKVWQTEMSFVGGLFDASIDNAITAAGWIHDALTTGNVNAWHWWWTRNDQSNNLGLIGNAGDDTLTKRLYMLGQWAKFVRPGYYRVGLTGAPTGVKMTAFRDIGTKTAVIVAVNTNVTTNAIRVRTTNEFLGNAVTIYETSATNSLASVGSASVNGGAFNYTLPATSITTFIGTFQ